MSALQILHDDFRGTKVQTTNISIKITSAIFRQDEAFPGQEKQNVKKGRCGKERDRYTEKSEREKSEGLDILKGTATIQKGNCF